MADIIDLEFYRKFRVILPIYSPSCEDELFHREEKNPIKTYRRRRKSSPVLSPEAPKTEKKPR